MEPWPFEVPGLETLTHGLTAVLGENGHGAGQVVVLHRKPNVYTSSFASEIVTCQLTDGSKKRLLCKYAERRQDHDLGHGYWGDAAYEAQVYRHILQPSTASTPKFYGTYIEEETGRTWLILEYLDNCQRVGKSRAPRVMGLAARWIGRFHAANEGRISSAPMLFLNVYDQRYYAGWIRRTLQFTGQWQKRFPWLARVCQRSEEVIPSILDSAPTVIHGEYYPHNVLFRGKRIHPIDWETAAIAAGEIDLACLTDGWPAEETQQCELEYRGARWPEGFPTGFERTLCAARLYVDFRWLGAVPDWTNTNEELWRFEQIRSVSERLGLT